MNRYLSVVLALMLCLTVFVMPTAAADAEYLAIATNDAIIVSNSAELPDAHVVTPSVYKIDGSNYFKLRDVAMMLNGSGRQFAVDYDSGSGLVKITTGKAYVPAGAELTGSALSNAVAVVSNNTILIDGKPVDLTVYKINGSNYFMLRDLAKALDFSVGYDSAAKIVCISGAKGYGSSNDIDFNVRYVRTGSGASGGPYPKTFWISDTASLDGYVGSLGGVSLMSADGASGTAKAPGAVFGSALDKYDDAFFENHELLFVVLQEPSGSIRHTVNAVKRLSGDAGNYIVQPIIERYVPEVGTCDMAEWHIIIEISKEYHAAQNEIRLMIMPEREPSL